MDPRLQIVAITGAVALLLLVLEYLFSFRLHLGPATRAGDQAARFQQHHQHERETKDQESVAGDVVGRHGLEIELFTYPVQGPAELFGKDPVKDSNQQGANDDSRRRQRAHRPGRLSASQLPGMRSGLLRLRMSRIAPECYRRLLRPAA